VENEKVIMPINPNNFVTCKNKISMMKMKSAKNKKPEFIIESVRNIKKAVTWSRFMGVTIDGVWIR
jgi:hypothetical protein